MQLASVQPTRGVAGTIDRYVVVLYPTAVLPFGIAVAYLDRRQADRASYQKGPLIKEVVVPG